MSLLRKHHLDYVPATTHGVDRYSHPWMARDPSYKRLLEFVDEHDHIFLVHLSYYGSFGHTEVLGVSDPTALERHTYRREGTTNEELILRTPRGNLTARYMEKDGVHTVWRHDLLIKSDEDIDRFLSAPLVPIAPNAWAFKEAQRALGDRGLMEIEIPDAVDLVVENMPYEDFLVWSLQAPARIEALLDRMTELLLVWAESLLQAGFGPVFRIFGPEIVAPPISSPLFFRKAVVERDRPLVDLIHRYGCYVRYHCHGPIARILDDMLSLGVDMTDPCEAPPGGDITLRQLADRVGKDMILMGNIQLNDIESAEPARINRLVAEAIDEVGGRSPFILCPTAPTFSSPLSPTTERNLIQFLSAAETYGYRSNP